MAVDVQGVDGLREFARDLRKVDRELAKQVSKAHRALAKEVAADARSKARSVYGRHVSQAKGISGRGTARTAKIALNTGRTPRLLAAEFGTKKHRVFGRSVLAQSMKRRVFPPWSGNQWQQGEGPPAGVGYAVHPTVRAWVQSGLLAGRYGDYLIDGFAPAFPD